MNLTTKRPSTTKDKLLKSVVEDEGEAKMNVNMEKKLYKRMKMKCVQEGKTLSEITRQLWIDYLKGSM